MRFAAFAASFLIAVGAAAQTEQSQPFCHEEAMLVFDASGSMSQYISQENGRRLDVARWASAEVLPDITADRPTGLVTYGGVPGGACQSVNLRLPPMQNSADLILAELMTLSPAGQTALSQATWLAAQTLDNGGQRPGTIVVVTDGIENCGLNACALGAKLQAEAPHITVHVIGFRLLSRREAAVACLAQTTGGTYTSVKGFDDLKRALKATLSCPRIS